MLLLAEANFCAEKLSLPVALPIQRTNLTQQWVTPVTMATSGGQGGRVDFGNYSLSTGNSKYTGAFYLIVKRDPFGAGSVAEENKVLMKATCLISTNGAYEIATNRLTMIDVDVKKLEASNKPRVQQRRCYSQDGGSEVFLPVFYVKWGSWQHPKAEVCIDGRDKSLVSIQLRDQTAFSRRPATFITNLDELLSIPDADFERYSPAQQTNLLAHFSAIPFKSLPRRVR